MRLCVILSFSAFLFCSWAAAMNEVVEYSAGTRLDYPGKFPIVQKSIQLDALISIKGQDQGSYIMVDDSDTICLGHYYLGHIGTAYVVSSVLSSSIVSLIYLRASSDPLLRNSVFATWGGTFAIAAYLTYCSHRIKLNSRGTSFDRAKKYKTVFSSNIKGQYIPPTTFYSVEQMDNDRRGHFLITPYGYGLKSPLPRCLTKLSNNSVPVIMDCAYERDSENRKIMTRSQLWSLDHNGKIIPSVQETTLQIENENALVEGQSQRIGGDDFSLYIDQIYLGKKVNEIGKLQISNVELLPISKQLDIEFYEDHLIKRQGENTQPLLESKY